MNPLRAHWFRLTLWLLVAAPIIAIAVALSSGVEFGLAVSVTLYIWVLVSVILALIALSGTIMRLLGRGVRAIRR
jgi:hypothetical protein